VTEYHAVIAFRELGSGTCKAAPLSLRLRQMDGLPHLVWHHPESMTPVSIPLEDVESIRFIHEEDDE